MNRSSKTHTTIYLSGIEFRISATESEEYIQKLAVFVNRRIDDMQKQFPSVSISDSALLALFNLANDYHELKDSYDKLESRIGLLRENRTRMEYDREREAPMKRPFEREKVKVTD